MNLPGKESFDLAVLSAKEITSVKIEAETIFSFDKNYAGSNSVDRDFMLSIENDLDLNPSYSNSYING